MTKRGGSKRPGKTRAGDTGSAKARTTGAGRAGEAGGDEARATGSGRAGEAGSDKARAGRARRGGEPRAAGDEARAAGAADDDAPARDGVDAILEQWRRERPELDHSPIAVIGRISRLSRAIEARLEVVYKQHGLEPGWHDVLATLRRSGPEYRLRPTDLSNATMLTSSGMTKRLDRLEQAGLIAREPDRSDRRGTLIALTPRGRELIDRLTEAHLENERRILGGLDPTEQRELANLLRKLQLGLPPLD